MSKVWPVYREKIAKVNSLEALIEYRHSYIKGYGLGLKVDKGYLVPYRYNMKEQ